MRRFEEPFTGVVAEAGVDLRIDIVVGESRVEVHGADSVRTEVRGGVLNVQAPDPRIRAFVKIEVPRLTGLTTHGAGLVDVRDLAEDELVVSIDGDSDVRLRGTARTLRLTVEDAARLDVRDLADAEVSLRHEGTSEVQLRGTVAELVASVRSSGPFTVDEMAGPARVTASGSALVILNGAMPTLDVSVSGSAVLAAHDLVADEVQVAVAGTATADLAGLAARVDVRSLESGQVVANALSAEVVDVLLRGAGRVHVNASQLVSGQVLAGELVLGGTPARVTVTTSGTGQVTGAGAQ